MDRRFSGRVGIVVTLETTGADARVIDCPSNPRYGRMATAAFRGRGNMVGSFPACAHSIVAARTHTRDLGVIDPGHRTPHGGDVTTFA